MVSTCPAAMTEYFEACPTQYVSTISEPQGSWACFARGFTEDRDVMNCLGVQGGRKLWRLAPDEHTGG